MILSKPHVVILGRGIFGLCLGVSLLRRGVRVSFFGQPSGLEVASQAATGISCQKGLLLGVTPGFRAKLHGQRLSYQTFKSLGAWVGEKVWEPYQDVADYTAKFSRPYRFEPRGLWPVQNKQRLPSGLEKLYHAPHLGVLEYSRDFFFDPGEVLSLLERQARDLGAEFLPEQVNLACKQGQLVIAQDPHFFAGAQVVVAAGAASAPLLEEAGMVAPKHFTVWGASLCFESFKQPPVYAAMRQGQQSLVATPNGLRYGSVSQAKNKPLSSQELARGLDQNKKLWPCDFSSQFERKILYGNRLAFKSRYPIADKVPGVSNGWLFSGAYKSGYDLGPLLANALACYMLTGCRPPSLESFVWPRTAS